MNVYALCICGCVVRAGVDVAWGLKLVALVVDMELCMYPSVRVSVCRYVCICL